ncbi:MAG: GTP-binding protein, partial [Solirubrobacterales bacterium]
MANHDSTGDAPLITTDASALTDMLNELERQNESDVVAKARESLEETFQNLQLTADEEGALADELRQLRALTEKLDQNTIEIAAFGMVSRGKSSVL